MSDDYSELQEVRYAEDDRWALFPRPEQSLLCCGFVGVLLLVALGLLSGCAVDPGYVAADRATFDAVAKPFLGYVYQDRALDPEQVARRERLIRSWEARIEKAEGQ